MSDMKMYFGNRNYMQWVECPQAGVEVVLSGSSQTAGYLSGGAFRRQSFNASKTFKMNWALTSGTNIRAISDYVEGVYGEGPIYWSDPFNMDQNVLAQSMATPSLGGHDGVILSGSKVRPELVPTSANPYGYPTESAVYTLNAATDAPLRHWVPIPPGYVAWVGVHGSGGTGGKVYARTTTGATTGNSPVELSINPVTSASRVVESFSGPSIQGVEIYLGGTGIITLSGIIVQVLPAGVPPQLGGFISGQGHSGCSFDGWPAKNNYSAAMDLVSLSASFLETEQWR